MPRVTLSPVAAPVVENDASRVVIDLDARRIIREGPGGATADTSGTGRPAGRAHTTSALADTASRAARAAHAARTARAPRVPRLARAGAPRVPRLAGAVAATLEAPAAPAVSAAPTTSAAPAAPATSAAFVAPATSTATVAPATPAATVAPPSHGSDAAHDARPARRVSALDALRGIAVVLMLLVNNPGDRLATLAPLRHAVWQGFTPADVVFPLFLFAVGASLPFTSRPATLRTAARRAALIFALGCALSSVKQGAPTVGMGVLQHVAGAYFLGWALTRLPRRWWAASAAGVLAAGWAVYAFLPAPGAVRGSYAKDLTPAAALDRLMLGGPHPEGLLVTALSAASVVGGALLGAAVRSGLSAGGVRRLALRHAAVAGGAGLLLSSVVPVVKQLWTPSYALLGHAAACVLLAALTAAPDRRTGWLRAVGANPLAVYVLLTLAGLTVLVPLAALLVPALATVVPGWAASLLWASAVAGAGVQLAVVLQRRGVHVRL